MSRYLRPFLIGATLLFLPIACRAGESASAETGLSLAEAVQQMLSGNPAILISRQGLEVSKGDLMKTQGAFDWVAVGQFSQARETYPQEDRSDIKSDNSAAGLSLSRKSRTGPSISQQIQLTRTDDRSRGAETINSSNVVFQLNLPLLKGSGAVSAAAGENAAKAGVLASEYLVTHSVASAARDTIKKYWQYVAAIRLLEQARDAESRVATLLSETEQLVDAEQLPRSSLSSVKASHADKRAQVESRKYLVKEAWEQLALMFGSSHQYMFGPAAPMTDFPFFDETRLSLIGNDVSQLRQHAIENRYDLKAQKEQLNASNILYRAAEHDLKPQVDLSFSLGYQGFKTGNGGDSYLQGLSSNRSDPKWQATLSFTGPLENRSAEGTLMSRKASLTSSRLTTDSLMDQIRTQVTLAVSNLGSLSAELSASWESVTQYLKAVEDEREKLRLGLSTLFAVIDAEDRLALSQGRLITVTGQLAQALVDLRFYSGTLVGKDEGRFMIDAEAVTTLPDIH